MAGSSSPRVSPKGKGKAKAVAAPSPSPSKPAPQLDEDDEQDSDLLALADAITAQAHVLVPGKSNEELARQASEVVKASFDRALQSESLAFKHLSNLLESMNPSAGPSTRSSTQKAAAADPLDEPEFKLSLTPLPELTTEGMDPEMIWEQMEMRTGPVVDLLDHMFGGGEGEEDEEGGMEIGSDESDEEDAEMFGEFGGEEEGDEEHSEEEEEGSEDYEGDEGEFESEQFEQDLGQGSDPFEAESSEEPEDPLADVNKDLTLDTFDKPGSGGKRQRRAPGPPSAVDDTFFSLHDFHVQTDEGEFEMARALRGEADDDEGSEDDFDMFAPIEGGDEDEEEDEEDEEDLDAAGVMYKDFFDPPPRPVAKGKDAVKGKAKGKGKAKADPSDVVPSPAAVSDPATKKRKVKFSTKVHVKTIPPNGSEFDKLVAKFGWEKASEMLDGAAAAEGAEEDDEESEAGSDEELGEALEGVEEEDDVAGSDVEMDDEEEEEEGAGEEGSEAEYESEDEGMETIERFKDSLFDDEDDEDDDSSPAAKLSKHERRLLALSSQIAALEAENVGEKDWATRGEAKARDRPVNSLLEEDLEYERAGKVVPVITEETTKTIEDLIKKRILDNDFDDVVRQRAVDPNAFLPSRFMEIQDTKSNKSLAEIYEEDYTNAREKEAGREVVHELDKDLEKKHVEIEELFEDLASRLDALSNARFTPKPPKASITTISNLPSVSLESALPTTSSTATLLAPEEVFVPDPTKEDRSDFTPSQKKQARQKRRKARASMAKAAEKFSKGEKGEKERATKQLLGTKGVTVIGKGGKVEKPLKRKRASEDEGRSGVSLKL
ncbi:U3 small nucleolar RNA-associated protein MPP10 [Pseudohyphozyma bogoriensis]|nr:U3 small nucleolar RNA-associated protein MPP10 [Pseudohyphozyma bogoriensis]